MSCTDSGLTAAGDARGRLLLRGVAAGADGAGTELSLAFEGTTICACVKPGTTASQAVALLERALPEGYRLSVAEDASGEVAVELIRSPNAPPPAREAAQSKDDAAPFRADAFVG